MTRFKDRQKAIILRKQGKTYSQIKKALNLSKSTLSDWLSRYPLSRKQLEMIKRNSTQYKDVTIEKCRLTKQKKRQERIKIAYSKEKKRFLPLSKREIYLSGLFLYWGEGRKNLRAPITLNNTDPKVIKFYLYWLTKILKIPKDKIKVYVHLYSDMNINESIEFWSKELKIPKEQFIKPYIKISKRSEIDQKGFGHGTCALTLNDVYLKEKILLGIEAVADYYTKKI